MERLEMNHKERERLEVFSRVKRGELALAKAAQLVYLSYRQAKRVYRRYRQQGDAGLVHRLRGQASNRKTDDQRRQAILSRYRERYADFGPTLAMEYLRREGLPVGVETLRRWLLAEGLWNPKRRRSTHRRWRARREHVGEMVQMDGSEHDWFEGRGERAVLMVMIDDATNRTYARFYPSETTAAAFDVFGRYVQRYGVPRALYVDKDSIYRTTRSATAAEELAAEPAKTQFGRAMSELRVELILAHSPQAKGRVERRHGVFQDRLVKALRLENIQERESANAYLEQAFLPELNGRFTVPAKRSADLHRRLDRDVDLDRVLSFQEERVVQKDWTLRWRNRWFQLTAANQGLALVGRRVLICEQLDGRIRLCFQERELTWRELAERPSAVKDQSTDAEPNQGSKPRCGPDARKPAANHPWRHFRLH